MLTLDQLEEGVDDDGIVDNPMCQEEGDIGVECRYARMEAIFESDVPGTGDGFLSILGDYQDCFIVIRVPYSQLELNGWKRPTKTSDAERKGEPS